jgi:hypothetical protein
MVISRANMKNQVTKGSSKKKKKKKSNKNKK